MGARRTIMAISQRLQLKQSQSLFMTPQLQQAIKLLQLNNLEVGAFLEAELERNPMLETDDFSDENASASQLLSGVDREPAETPTAFDGANADTVTLTNQDAMAEGNEAPLDTSYENVYDAVDVRELPPDMTEGMSTDGMAGLSGSSSGSGRGEGNDRSLAIERAFGERLGLKEHLEEQARIDIADPLDRAIADYLIGSLDPSGMLRLVTIDVADALGTEADRVEYVISLLQRLDPPGVFARDLPECLTIQLRERNRLDPMIEQFVQHLDLVAQGDLPAVMKACACTAEDITDMLREIRTLNPRPAVNFDGTPADVVVPDILMRRAPGETWIIELNPDTLPRVLVNHKYYATVSTGSGRLSKNDREYISEQLNAANWLVKSLHQRATTIIKVTTEIVRQQAAFFEHGVAHLKPLVLRNVADAIDMHESTVSRVTSNKYLACPRGVFELKYFFTAAIGATDGATAHSAESVRYRIKTLIDAEDAKKVLSDDQIVVILRKGGIDIARRTVAKYREAMGIASSVQRRRQKVLAHKMTASDDCGPALQGA
jgi:RNA polymerase sigma-54 factor